MPKTMSEESAPDREDPMPQARRGSTCRSAVERFCLLLLGASTTVKTVRHTKITHSGSDCRGKSATDGVPSATDHAKLVLGTSVC